MDNIRLGFWFLWTKSCIFCISLLALRSGPLLLNKEWWWWCVDSIISNVLSVFCASAFFDSWVGFHVRIRPLPSSTYGTAVEVDTLLNLNQPIQRYSWELMIVFSCLGKRESGRMKAWWVWQFYLFIRI